MIVLDTNVLSALMHIEPDRVVLSWLDRQPLESIWITSITVFEAKFGLELLPSGRRRMQLERALELVMQEDLAGRVLSFDQSAAEQAAILAAQRKRAGTPVDFRDTAIAGIVLARRAMLATRNRRHFSDAGISLVDPWTA
ncbi:type II toxin-antitoxin system VapC family toxin [Methylobacterium tardum]|nr:type II toxin-antitoxin system VapC family toxin [Methylobacterium tardum]URD37895.1 type II toxin-antitoxin system VapC family toxin [Methylobacterium tardum]